MIHNIPKDKQQCYQIRATELKSVTCVTTGKVCVTRHQHITVCVRLTICVRNWALIRTGERVVMRLHVDFTFMCGGRGGGRGEGGREGACLGLEKKYELWEIMNELIGIYIQTLSTTKHSKKVPHTYTEEYVSLSTHTQEVLKTHKHHNTQYITCTCT